MIRKTRKLRLSGFRHIFSSRFSQTIVQISQPASDNVTVTGLHEIYGLLDIESAWEAYARRLPTVFPKNMSDTYALFLVYEDNEPSFTLLLQYDKGK